MKDKIKCEKYSNKPKQRVKKEWSRKKNNKRDKWKTYNKMGDLSQTILMITLNIKNINTQFKNSGQKVDAGPNHVLSVRGVL